MPNQKRTKNQRAAAPLFAPSAVAPYDQDNDAEYDARQRKRRKRRRSDRAYTVAMVFFALVFLASGGMLVKRYLEDRQAESEFAALAQLIDHTAQPAATGGGADDNVNEAKFAALKDQNSDFVGWISIEGTNLDFPVMQTPGNPNYYLRHDFHKVYSVYGVPYLDEDCTLGGSSPSNNLVIYGHNMKTGTIFGCLTEYKKAEYYQSHPVIRFDTLYGDGEYEVFAAFAIDVAQDTSFVYNSYLDMDETAFQQYVSEVKRRSDVESGITPAYGEQLLTLSTCEYSSADGRYVVCARKIQAAD